MPIKTLFPKFGFGLKDLPKWSLYFNAGGQWLKTYELVRDQKKKEGSWDFLYFVEPYALFFSIELLVKALVARLNPAFNAQKDRDTNGRILSHRVTAIINTYKTEILSLSEIANNDRLFHLIKVYEDTVTTRFGETAVSMNSEDSKLLSDLAENLWEEVDVARKSDEKISPPII